MTRAYVHGYDPREAIRLQDQASTLTELLHADTAYGSAYFHPDSRAAHEAIQCLVELQRRAGGDAMIGRTLYPLLQGAGFEAILVSPRMVYADASRPELVEGFTRKTFTAMVAGVRDAAIAAGLAGEKTFDQGIRDLERTAQTDGVFCYTFFKAVAICPAPR
jgi:hypothetical protein